jgi:monoterpene epsilon-lactone hydrolase
MASQELGIVIDMMRANPPIADREDVGAARTRMDMMTTAMPLPPDVRYEAVDAGGVPAEWTAAPGAAADRVIVYLHGGGYVVGSVRTHRLLVADLSRATGARVLSVDYRLAPEHPFPAAVEDAVTACRFVRRGGVAPARMAVAGDSAGGGLTVATLLALRDAREPLPAAAVCLSPWLDLSLSGESMRTKETVDPMIHLDGARLMAERYLGGADARSPLASPLFAELAGLPPLLIQVGTAETLLDDSTRFAARARAAGVAVELEEWEDMFHVWHAFAFVLPEAREAIARIGAFLRPRLG